MSYARIDLNDPTYSHVKKLMDAGVKCCDSLDHNENDGCSNPECFKHPATVTIPTNTLKEGTRVTIKATGTLGEDAGFNITKPIERKLDAFARRLRLLGNHKGSTFVGKDSYEIQVDGAGYTLLAVNGRRNPCLEES